MATTTKVPAASEEDVLDGIQDIISSGVHGGLDTLTCRGIRFILATKLGLEKNALDARKDEVRRCIDHVLQEQQKDDESPEKNEADQEEEEEDFSLRVISRTLLHKTEIEKKNTLLERAHKKHKKDKKHLKKEGKKLARIDESRRAERKQHQESLRAASASAARKAAAPPKKKKKRAKTKAQSENGFTAACRLSPALAELMGGEAELPRTQVVKRCWDYIREHNLQNPADKREIILDEAMRAVFGCETFTMFTMNRYLSEHVFKKEKEKNVVIENEDEDGNNEDEGPPPLETVK